VLPVRGAIGCWRYVTSSVATPLLLSLHLFLLSDLEVFLSFLVLAILALVVRTLSPRPCSFFWEVFFSSPPSLVDIEQTALPVPRALRQIADSSGFARVQPLFLFWVTRPEKPSSSRMHHPPRHPFFFNMLSSTREPRTKCKMSARLRSGF